MFLTIKERITQIRPPQRGYGWLRPMPAMVGEAPSRKYGHFAGPAFDRLAQVLGRPLADKFELINLLPRPQPRSGKGSAFPLEEAKLQASDWLRHLTCRKVVLLGHRAASVFGITAESLSWIDHGMLHAAILPHPSGVDRWWNDAKNVIAAGEFLRSI